MNPYLAMTVQLAAGIKGIEDSEKLDPPSEGDAYEGTGGFIPQNLRDAKDAMNGSKMLREALGEDVVNHYTRGAVWELDEFAKVVTDWELQRGFEQS